MCIKKSIDKAEKEDIIVNVGSDGKLQTIKVL